MAGEVCGVDISEQAIDSARRRLAEAHVVDLDREIAPFPPRSFDTLIYGDVLEHLTFPWITSKHHSTLLRPGGRAFCSAPNIGHRMTLIRLLRQKWEYETEGLFDYTPALLHAPLAGGDVSQRRLWACELGQPVSGFLESPPLQPPDTGQAVGPQCELTVDRSPDLTHRRAAAVTDRGAWSAD
jgi:SAM-dependent methyltransferase